MNTTLPPGARTGLRVLTLIALLVGIPAAVHPAPATTELIGGRWFDGTRFAERDRTWIENGRFVETRPATIERSVDLTGLWIVPPFGDAHHHAVDPYRIRQKIRSFLDEGVFYVKNPASLPRETAQIRSKIDKATSIDVTFAGGVLTAPDGHPIQIAQGHIDQGTWTEADGEGGFYFAVADLADLEAKWPAILEQPRDFLKTFLLYSEDYLAHRDDPAYYGAKGLDPELLPEIVERAHAAGLRVSTHIESAADFRAATRAGVDEINHMVGFRPDADIVLSEGFRRYKLRRKDAKKAARTGLTVVTTLGGLIEALDELEADPETAPVARAGRKVVRRNLKLLRKTGVPIAIGGDRYEETTRAEIRALHSLGSFSNLDLLRAWCETTPRTIFPERMIARLAPGFEGSFLALDGDPLTDFSAVERVATRVKQGRVLR